MMYALDQVNITKNDFDMLSDIPSEVCKMFLFLE